MTETFTDTAAVTAARPPRTAAVTAASALLAMAVLGIFGNAVVLTLTGDDAPDTLANVQAGEGTLRLAIVAFVFVAILDVVVAWALTRFFRTAQPGLATLAGWLQMASTTVPLGRPDSRPPRAAAASAIGTISTPWGDEFSDRDAWDLRARLVDSRRRAGSPADHSSATSRGRRHPLRDRHGGVDRGAHGGHFCGRSRRRASRSSSSRSPLRHPSSTRPSRGAQARRCARRRHRPRATPTPTAPARSPWRAGTSAPARSSSCPR